MIKLFGKPEYKIRINYKNGIQEEFWCTEFEISGGRWVWSSCSNGMKPIVLNIDTVDSVWQIGYRKPLFYKGE